MNPDPTDPERVVREARHVLDIAVDHSISISEAFRVKAATDRVQAEKDRRCAPGARGQAENETEEQG